MRIPENLHSFYKILSNRGLRVLYGPPLSYKTKLALSYILLRGEKPSTYVGLGKHVRVADRVKGLARTYSFLSLVEEIESLTNLVLNLREGEFLAYDGFGATLLPFRCDLREISAMRIALFITALLKLSTQTHSASVLILTTETAKGRPLFFKALSRFSDAFVRARKNDDVLELTLHNPQMLELWRIRVPASEVNELLGEQLR